MEASDMTDLLEEEFQTRGFFENIYFSDVSRLLKQCQTLFFFFGSKISADGDWAMKLKDAYSLEGKLWPT